MARDGSHSSGCSWYHRSRHWSLPGELPWNFQRSSSDGSWWFSLIRSLLVLPNPSLFTAGRTPLKLPAVLVRWFVTVLTHPVAPGITKPVISHCRENSPSQSSYDCSYSVPLDITKSIASFNSHLTNGYFWWNSTCPIQVALTLSLLSLISSSELILPLLEVPTRHWSPSFILFPLLLVEITQYLLVSLTLKQVLSGGRHLVSPGNLDTPDRVHSIFFW